MSLATLATVITVIRCVSSSVVTVFITWNAMFDTGVRFLFHSCQQKIMFISGRTPHILHASLDALRGAPAQVHLFHPFHFASEYNHLVSPLIVSLWIFVGTNVHPEIKITTVSHHLSDHGHRFCLDHSISSPFVASTGLTPFPPYLCLPVPSSPSLLPLKTHVNAPHPSSNLYPERPPAPC